MEKLHNLTHLISRNEVLYISKVVENQYTVTTSQYEISGKNSHLLSQNVFLQSIIYPSEKTIYWNKRHEVKVVSCLTPLLYTMKHN